MRKAIGRQKPGVEIEIEIEIEQTPWHFIPQCSVEFGTNTGIREL